ncbi:MAG: N-acetylmuramic acid 6-phosphate etherase [Woeseia sp.]
MHENLTTEAANPAAAELDKFSTLEMVQLTIAEDAKIAAAVAEQSEVIASAIDLIAARMAEGGRLIYVGAGTSGRLGVLDASECPPTFNADPAQVVGVIAGGDVALRRAIEGAEDSSELGAQDVQKLEVSARDTVVGITASGTTPYVLAALDAAKSLGATTIGFTCNRDAPIAGHADITIAVVVGPEVLAGSTRMKAGTATKMVLNMLTTGAMVRLGKTYGNLMVDLQASNDKLVARSVRILKQLSGLDAAAASALLQTCNGELKTAIVSQRLGIDAATARQRLQDAAGRLRRAMGEDE